MWFFDSAYGIMCNMKKGKIGVYGKSSLFLLVLLSIVICGLIVGVIVVINSNKLIINTAEEAANYLIGYANAGDLEELIRETDKALAAATNDVVKADIYMIRANALFNYNEINDNEYLEQMLSDAYSAENLNPTAQSAYRIYVGEKARGNEEKAEEYFEKAKGRGLFDNPGRG